MANILVDSGVWFALFDARDGYHSAAAQKLEVIEKNVVILPWPIMYETLNTRFVRNSVGLRRIRSIMKNPRTAIIDDNPYRDGAVDEMLMAAFARARTLSLVDCVLREMMRDINVRVDAFLTFNEGDFAGVCRARSIPFG